jgi:hypothetical protein
MVSMESRDWPEPAPRVFDEISSVALRDIVHYEGEAIKLLLAFDRPDVPSSEEFKPAIRVNQLLIQKIMVELLRRGNLPADDMTPLMELSRSVSYRTE